MKITRTVIERKINWKNVRNVLLHIITLIWIIVMALHVKTVAKPFKELCDMGAYASVLNLMMSILFEGFLIFLCLYIWNNWNKKWIKKWITDCGEWFPCFLFGCALISPYVTCLGYAFVPSNSNACLWKHAKPLIIFASLLFPPITVVVITASLIFSVQFVKYLATVVPNYFVKTTRNEIIEVSDI